MLLFNALTSVVLEAARIDPPRDPALPRLADPRPFRLSHDPFQAVPAAIPFSTPVSGPLPATRPQPVRLFGRLLVEE